MAGGVLVGAAAVTYRRRWRSACLSCGRTDPGRRPARPPRWAWWAAYVAVGGWLVRLFAQLAVGWDRSPLREGGSLLVFEVGFVLAGTVLPLALVHPWGRVFPRWVPLVAGRRVPRWLLLVAGVRDRRRADDLFRGRHRAAYRRDVAWHLGPRRQFSALAFFWVAMPAYLVWGLGLGAAAVAYRRATRPPCRVCGR